MSAGQIAVAALSTLLALVAVVGAGGRCPGGSCYCADMPRREMEYICHLPAGNVSLNTGYKFNRNEQYVTLTCDSGSFRCSELPALPDIQGVSLYMMGVSKCSLSDQDTNPDTIMCALRAVGANSTRGLTLNRVPMETIRLTTFQGLTNITELIFKNDKYTSLSIPSLETLHKLGRLKVNGGQLQLQNVTFNGMSLLKWLELSDCGLADLPDGVFRELKNLQILSLWSNKIKVVGSKSFEGMISLEEIDLSSNSITVISKHTFVPYTKIKIINLDSNPLNEIETGAFEGLKSIETLSLKYGRGDLLLGDRVFADLPSLKELNIENSGLQKLPPHLLTGSFALTDLNFAGNSIEELPIDLFRDQTSLVKLHLEKNKIKILTPNVFVSLGKLEELNLNANLIEELPDGVFNGLSAMQELTLRKNSLQVVTRGVFPARAAITRLDLARNKLQLQSALLHPTDEFGFGAKSPFVDLQELKSLDLSHNLLKDIFFDWKAELSNLEKLDLTNNLFECITDADVNFLQANIKVDLRRNNITAIILSPTFTNSVKPMVTNSSVMIDTKVLDCNCTLLGLVQRIHGGVPFTTEARIELDEVQCSSPRELQGVTARDLQPSALTCKLDDHICTPGCNCTVRPYNSTLELVCVTLPPENVFDFITTHNYKYATLRLLSSPISLMELSPHITVLRLNSLNMTLVPPLPSHVVLEELDLAGNALTYVPSEILALNTSLRLAGNPLSCECLQRGDLALLQAAARAGRVLDADEVRCADGASVLTVDATRLCDVLIATVVGAVLAALGLVAALTAYLLYRYGIALRVLFYDRGWCLGVENDDDHEFDAFVSFAHQDHWFVVEQLLPRLESGPHSYRVCVHFRNWTAGDWVPTLIENSIEQSRRTLVVVTKAFLASTWSRLEFRAAHERALRDARPRLVLVLVDDVMDDPRLDRDMRAYLLTNSFIRWGEPRFWGRLHAALSRGCRPRPDPVPTNPESTPPISTVEKTYAALDVRLSPDGKLFNHAALALDKV